jgi:hypothetical protein
MVRSPRGAAVWGVNAQLCELLQCDKSGKEMLRGGGLIATRASRDFAFAPPFAPRVMGSSGGTVRSERREVAGAR